MEEANNVVTELLARSVSHPTVSTIWLMAIENSINRLEEALANARRALDVMHTDPDITLDQLTGIYAVFGNGR